MSVSYTGGCCECGRLVTTSIYGNDESGQLYILCQSCYDEKYSPEAKDKILREKKFKRILKPSLLQRIKKMV